MIFFDRHVLANLHFNENVKRATHQSKDGSDYIKVAYPKFKLEEEVVREVAVPPTYSKNTKKQFSLSMITHFHATHQYNQIHLLFSGYVDEMRNLLFNLSKTAISAAKYNNNNSTGFVPFFRNKFPELFKDSD